MVPVKLKAGAEIFGKACRSGDVVIVNPRMAEIMVREGEAEAIEGAERDEILRKAGVSGGVSIAAFQTSNGSTIHYR